MIFMSFFAFFAFFMYPNHHTLHPHDVADALAEVRSCVRVYVCVCVVGGRTHMLSLLFVKW